MSVKRENDRTEKQIGLLTTRLTAYHLRGQMFKLSLRGPQCFLAASQLVPFIWLARRYRDDRDRRSTVRVL